MNLKEKVRQLVIAKINRTGLNCEKTQDLTEIQDGESFEFDERVYNISYDIKIIFDKSKVEEHGGITDPKYTTGEVEFYVDYLEVSLYDENEELIEFDDLYLWDEINNYLN